MGNIGEKGNLLDLLCPRLLSNMWKGIQNYRDEIGRRLEELELKTFSLIDNDFIVASWKDNNNLIVPRFSIFQIDT